MTDLIRQSATEIARDVRQGSLSARDVLEAHLAQIDRHNPTINAIVQDTRTEAFDTADQVDAQIARGEDPGVLAGVPITIKVNVDQVGYATTNGLASQAGLVADQDSPVVSNLRKAGAVVIGRTNTPAYSLRWFTKNDLHGQTLNPRNPGLTPGGSSGGAGAAVAAGFCTIGHGTDIAGSVRYPAYACGVHGLRPSQGRIPTYNATSGDRFIGAQLMAVSGPLARSVKDIGLSLAVMSGQDLRDPWYVPASLTGPGYAKRAALLPAPDGMPVAPEISAALAEAARILTEQGWTIEERDGPPMRQAAKVNATLWMAETQMAAKALLDGEAEEDAQFVYEMMTRDIGMVGLDEVMLALKTRAGLVREWELFLADYPLVLCPVSGELPFDQQLDVRSEADFMRVYEAQLTQRGLPVMGMPSLSLATGEVNGRPVGVQLVAARFREDILLDAAAVIEADSPKSDVADLT